MAICKLSAAERKELESLFTDFDNARSALYDRLNEIADEWREAWGERSEKWQAGENGSAANDRIDSLEAMRDQFEATQSLDLDDI